MTVRMKVVNAKQFAKKIQQHSKDVERNLKKAVRVAATETRNTAVVSILQNPRAGGSVTRYSPTRTINISAAGDAPAGDTGFLAANIELVMAPDGMSAEVQSRADYSAALEFGTRDMAARPFLQPALEEGRKKYERMFAKAVKDGI
jgi:HK97 gp10 family phage protein